MNRAVLKFRQLIEQYETRPCDAGDSAAIQAISQTLYGWFFPKALQAELNGKIKHLVFAQDRITHYVPMSALFDGKQYLIERYTVSMIVSAKYTDTEGPHLGIKNTSVLATGLSNRVPPDFPPLTSVPAELNAIVQTGNRGDRESFPV